MLFRNFPIIVAHVSSLSDLVFVTHDSTGVPILVTRNQAGEVQGFINVCRHRGARRGRPAARQNVFLLLPWWTYDTGVACEAFGKQTILAPSAKEYGLIRQPAFERCNFIGSDPPL